VSTNQHYEVVKFLILLWFVIIWYFFNCRVITDFYSFWRHVGLLFNIKGFTLLFRWSIVMREALSIFSWLKQRFFQRNLSHHLFISILGWLIIVIYKLTFSHVLLVFLLHWLLWSIRKLLGRLVQGIFLLIILNI
jgi:hypothetical protein